MWLGVGKYLGENNGEVFRALKIFYILIGAGIMQVDTIVKTHHLRFVQDTICKLAQ